MRNTILTYCRARPGFSTYAGAFYLSTVWVTVWMLVFFSSTVALSLETSATSFIVAFWLSIVAETVIRFTENADFAAQLSKPNDNNAKGDNSDFTALKALSLLLLQLAFMSLYFGVAYRMPDLLSLPPDLIFTGQDKLNGQYHSRTFAKMFTDWWMILSNSGVAWCVFIGFCFRIFIYKREP